MLIPSTPDELLKSLLDQEQLLSHQRADTHALTASQCRGPNRRFGKKQCNLGADLGIACSAHPGSSCIEALGIRLRHSWFGAPRYTSCNAYMIHGRHLP